MDALLKKFANAMSAAKAVSSIVGIVSIVIGVGIWIGSLQSVTQANTLAVTNLRGDFEVQRVDREKFVKEIYLYMGEANKNIAIIKTELRDQRREREDRSE